MLQLPETKLPTARQRNRSAAQIAEANAARLRGFERLEYGLADLVQMTSIAGTLVESLGQETIDVGNTAWTAKQAIAELKKTGDQLMFMVYEIEQRAQALNDEWYAAACAGDQADAQSVKAQRVPGRGGERTHDGA